MSALETPSFRVTRFRESYRMSDVDTFLADIRPWLEGRLPNPDLAERIRGSRFQPIRLKPGYDMSDVDNHLDRLEALASQGHPPR